MDAIICEHNRKRIARRKREVLHNRLELIVTLAMVVLVFLAL